MKKIQLLIDDVKVICNDAAKAYGIPGDYYFKKVEKAINEHVNAIIESSNQKIKEEK